MNPTPAPYLSVVAASRNDDHGGDPLRRTQIFVSTFLAQCEKHRLPAELILVDWNPPADRPGLHAMLDFTGVGEFTQVRVIQVPAAMHDKFDYADKLLFFQMIAKNVGIRRARGEFVMATNIDILFSDELIAYLACKTLDPERMYRVDRYDIDNRVPANAPLEEQLRFCWEHLIRINALQYTGLPPEGAGSPVLRLSKDAQKRRPERWCRSVQEGPVRSWITDRNAPREQLHTNACGDFTLLSREKWHQLRGYAEFAAYSFHIDSVFCFAAHYSGVLETFLSPPCAAFHIEHSAGSGWTPEGHKALFERLEKKGIPSMENELLVELAEGMRAGTQSPIFNDLHWGLGQFHLDEVAYTSDGKTIQTASVTTVIGGGAEAVKACPILQKSESQESDLHNSDQPGSRIHDETGAGYNGGLTARIGSVLPEFDFHRLNAHHYRQENRRLQAELDDLKKAMEGKLVKWWWRSSRRWKRSIEKRSSKLSAFFSGLGKNKKA